MAAFFIAPDGHYCALPVTCLRDWLDGEQHDVPELQLRAYSVGAELNALASEVICESEHNVRGVAVLVRADGSLLDARQVQNLYSLCAALRQLQARSTHT